MKKTLLILFTFLGVINNCAKSQSSIVTATFQITNTCTTCCNGTISVTGITYTCPSTPPINLALITPTTGSPIFGNTSTWTGLCNGVYTVAVNFNGDPNPSACGAYFTCSVGYNIPTNLVGIEVYKSNFDVFPNPANDKINVRFTSGEKEFTKAQIVNSVGQVVKEVELNNNTQINIEDLPSGVYILNCKNLESSIISKRFVVAR
jgi:hypothetical protein